MLTFLAISELLLQVIGVIVLGIVMAFVLLSLSVGAVSWLLERNKPYINPAYRERN